MAGAAADAIWLDVLPSMKGFGDKLAKEGGAEADKAGKGIGKKLGVGLLAGTAVVAGGAVVAAKALYSIGETFDEVADTIRVGTGATGKSLDALVDSAKNIGTKVPAEFDKIGTVVADVNTRLGLTGPTLEKFSSQVLEASRIMGEEIDIRKVSSAFSAFQIKGEKTTDAMDHLYRVSQATGVGINELAATVSSNAPAVQALGFSFEETAALVGNLDKAGLNSSKMMAGMSRGLIEVAKSGEKPQKAFKRVTDEIQGYIKKGKDAKAIELASKLFGTRNATQFIGALKNGALAMDDLGSVAGMTEDTILGAGQETMDFAEQWQLFKNNVLVKLEPIATKVFGAFGDGMKWLVDNGLPVLEDFGAAVQAVWDLLFGGDFTSSFSKIFGLEEDDPMVDNLFNIRDTVIEVFDNVKNAISTAITWVQDFWAEHGAAILAEFQRIFNQVSTTVSSVFDSVKSIVASVLGWIETFWDEWGSRILSFLQGLWDHVKGVIDGALQIVRGIFETFAGLFTGDWGRMWDGLVGVFKGVWKVVSNSIGQALDTLKLAWDLAWSGLVSIAGKIFGGLWDAISGPINRVLQFIQENFIDKINGLFEFLHIGVKISPIWVDSTPAVSRSGAKSGANRWLGQKAMAMGGGDRGSGGSMLSMAAGMAGGGKYVSPVGRPPSFPWGRYPSGGRHAAYDYAVPSGTPVRAPYGATVIAAGWDSTGFGNHVRTMDADGRYSIFGHLSSIGVSVGQRLAPGQVLGRSGNTGNSTGDHLHWERRTSPYAPGTAFNPDGSGAPGSGGNFITDFLANIVKSGISGIVNLASSGLAGLGWVGQIMGGVVKMLGTGVGNLAIRALGMDAGGQNRAEIKPLLFDSGGILPTGISIVKNATGRPEPLARVDRYGGELRLSDYDIQRLVQGMSQIQVRGQIAPSAFDRAMGAGVA